MEIFIKMLVFQWIAMEKKLVEPPGRGWDILKEIKGNCLSKWPCMGWMKFGSGFIMVTI